MLNWFCRQHRWIYHCRLFGCCMELQPMLDAVEYNGNELIYSANAFQFSQHAHPLFFVLSQIVHSFRITVNRQPWLHVDVPIIRTLFRIFICMFVCIYVYVVQQFYPASPLFYRTGTGMDSHAVEKLEQDKCSLNCMFCFLMVMDYNNVLILGDGFFLF